MSKIYLISGGERHALEHIGEGAALTEALSGEQTLRFTVLPEDLKFLTEGIPLLTDSEEKILTNDDLVIYASSLAQFHGAALVEFEGQYYDIASVRLSGNNLAAFAEVSTEHVTYRLNRPAYNVESLNLGGTYAQVLARVLAGTDFTPGTTPEGTIDTTVIEGVSRREALNTVAELMGGELDFDGWTVNVVAHRGSTERVDLMATGNISAVEVDENLVTGETAYRVGLIQRGSLSVGDEVKIIFRPFGLDAETRIIEMTRNPYKDTECTITVGAHIPEITDTFVDVTRKVLYKSEADIVISKYINSAEGKAELEAALTGSFVSQSQLEDYPTFSQLDTEIGQYIDGQEGTAKIISAASGTYQTIAGMSDYATTQAVSTAITQAVNPVAAQIDMTAAYGSGTIGSEVRALLQLVANPDSSQIMLKASKITLDGDLHVQKVFYYDGSNYYLMLTGQMESEATITHVGPKDIDPNETGVQIAQRTFIYGTQIIFGIGSRNLLTDNDSLLIIPSTHRIVPNADEVWTLGTNSSIFSAVFSRYYYFHDGTYLYTAAGGTRLYWHDSNDDDRRIF